MTQQQDNSKQPPLPQERAGPPQADRQPPPSKRKPVQRFSNDHIRRHPPMTQQQDNSKQPPQADRQPPPSNRQPDQRFSNDHDQPRNAGQQQRPARDQRDNRGNNNRANQPPEDRRDDVRDYRDYRDNDRQPGNAVQQRGGQDAQDGLSNRPTTVATVGQGQINSIRPTTQRNFISLVNTKSATAVRGESKPGTFYSRTLGTLETVTAEVINCYYRQRYQVWDDRAQLFRTYCEAQAPTINLLEGNGQPGGMCTECPLTQWTETPIEGTNQLKNVPPRCGEHVIFELFIHEVAATAFWDLSSMDNLDAIRSTINVLNDRFGWGQYVIQLYSSMRNDSRGEPRFTPHIHHRNDLQSFQSLKVIDGSAALLDADGNAIRELQSPNDYSPENWHDGAPPISDDPSDYVAPHDWRDTDDLPF